MDRASDFELCVGGVYPVFGGKLRLSCRWSCQETIHTEHNFHPFHPNCTGVAPETHQINWLGGSIDCTDLPSKKILFARTHSLILMSGFLFSIYSPRLLDLFYAKIFMLLNMYKN